MTTKLFPVKYQTRGSSSPGYVLIMATCRIYYAIPASNIFAEYIATGFSAKWVSPIHPVVKGTSYSQNNKFRLSSITPKVTRDAAYSGW